MSGKRVWRRAASHVVISPHGIAMPKGSHFTAMAFSLFLLFSTPNLWGHWTDLDQTWTHIHLWLLFEKFGQNLLGHLPHALGGGRRVKTAFWDWLWTLTKHIERDFNNRKETRQSTVTALHAAKFGELWSTNGWEWLPSFWPPLNFCIGRHCQPYRMGVI